MPGCRVCTPRRTERAGRASVRRARVRGQRLGWLGAGLVATGLVVAWRAEWLRGTGGMGGYLIGSLGILCWARPWSDT